MLTSESQAARVVSIPRRRFRKLWTSGRVWLANSLRKIQGDGPLIDLSDILYFGGIALVGVGTYQQSKSIGLIVTGAILLLTVKPLIHWIK